MGRSTGTWTGGRTRGWTGKWARATAIAWAIGWTALQAGAGEPASAGRGPVGQTALLSAAEAEALVRRIDFEGMPRDEAARIGPEGAARLASMLADPAERAHHGRILLALGCAAQPGALEAIEAWEANAGLTGEIDRAGFRAWQLLPFALAELSRADARALGRLEARFDSVPPRWSFRQFKGGRLQQMQRRAVASALAETGLPAAARALDALAQRTGDPDLARHLSGVRAGMVAPEVAPGETLEAPR